MSGGAEHFRHPTLASVAAEVARLGIGERP